MARKKNPECKGRDDYLVGYHSINGIIKDMLARKYETNYIGKHYTNLGQPYLDVGAAYQAFSRFLDDHVDKLQSTFGMTKNKACYEHHEMKYFVPLDKHLAYGLMEDDMNVAKGLEELSGILRETGKKKEADSLAFMSKHEMAALKKLETALDGLPSDAWAKRRKGGMYGPDPCGKRHGKVA